MTNKFVYEKRTPDRTERIGDLDVIVCQYYRGFVVCHPTETSAKPHPATEEPMRLIIGEGPTEREALRKAAKWLGYSLVGENNKEAVDKTGTEIGNSSDL